MIPAVGNPRQPLLLAAALVVSFGWAAPAAASVQIGQAGSSPFTCGGMTTSATWQHANVTGPSHRVPAGGGVITSWTTGGGPSDGLRARLEVVREGGSSPVVVGEGNLETGVPQLNPFTFPARIPVEGGDALGLETDSSLASICTLSAVPRGTSWTAVPIRDRGTRSPAWAAPIKGSSTWRPASSRTPITTASGTSRRTPARRRPLFTAVRVTREARGRARPFSPPPPATRAPTPLVRCPPEPRTRSRPTAFSHRGMSRDRPRRMTIRSISRCSGRPARRTPTR